MLARQLLASSIVGVVLLLLIIRMVQRGRLDISYCWMWLGIGCGTLLAVWRYDLLVRLSSLIGAVTVTTTLFLMGFIVVLLMCLQFSLVFSAHRRQIKRLTQHIALLEIGIKQARSGDDYPATPDSPSLPLPPA
jgi:hypothetical protein